MSSFKLNWGLVLLVLVFISGCVQTREETTQFKKDLPQINENLGISLVNINTDFYNYDINYAWRRMMNSLTITEPMVREMGGYENKIKNEMVDSENLINEFQQSKNVDTGTFSKNESDTISEIEKKISEYQQTKYSINSCINAMQTYRQFMDTLRLKLIKTEEFGTKTYLVNEEVSSENYDDALNSIEKTKQIVSEIRDINQNQSKLGIITYNTEVIGSWDIYSESLDELKKYVLYLKENDTTLAEAQYTSYSKKYTAAVKASEKENMNQLNNQLDNWYQTNIGICLDKFKQYR